MGYHAPFNTYKPKEGDIVNFDGIQYVLNVLDTNNNHNNKTSNNIIMFMDENNLSEDQILEAIKWYFNK
jgi:hypothetical protein